jgi:hypothetical protein
MVPVAHVPSGISAKVHPWYTQYAIICTKIKLIGIGVPSKYCDFPLASFGTMATVTLKRARRVRPQSTKKERRRWSSGVRMPREKAAAAGETPKDTLISLINPDPYRLPSPFIFSQGGKGLLTISTYQISKRVKFLSHKRSLLSPPCNLAVHEVEE